MSKSDSDFRRAMRERISANIRSHGHHLYSIMGGEAPRWCYTIGLTEKGLPELVLAGCATLSTQAAAELVNGAAKRLEQVKDPGQLAQTSEGFGSFTLEPVHRSWAELMLLGAMDHYNTDKIEAYQLRPEAEQETIDLPDMWQAYNPDEHRVWQWLDGGWPYEVPSGAMVVTNIDALKGYAISELVRWEEEVWEMFSGPGPEVAEDEMVPVPLATLLAFDPTLEAALALEPGVGLYREHDAQGNPGPWQDWRASGG